VLKNTLIHSVTVIYTIAIAVLSLAHLTELPELNTGVDDKIVHFVLYAGLCLFWFMSLYVLKTKSSLLIASLLSIVFGGVIEVLQGVVSIYRTTDIFDFVANCLGVLTIALVIYTKKEVIIKKL
jgi:VanZ family protein|tara:strand:+ start:71 stop:442 length:372 start_codon:yes stop_codon:yes gene_type:complete